MSEINHQALREIAKQATQGEWVAFISTGTGTYVVHTPGDKRCEDVIKWPGFDGQKNAENNARYIAAFNPEVVLALLDELEADGTRIAELTDALTQMINAHKTTIRSGYERIIECGGDCDSPEIMISESPEIRIAETVLKTGIKSE
ncbi:ead/Ea22-like family protein [Escherichia marmotae]|uniref:ead/Ea22-like family protein n=1 Tax=Escherichia marmotae TaxID=1499973 RepID=UPI0020015A7C|nr:ead/Ea22-like family protein [Escherichia marmotae]